MEKNIEKQTAGNTQNDSEQKTNPVSNSSPVQDNSSPDNDEQSGSPRSAEESNKQTSSETKSNR